MKNECKISKKIDFRADLESAVTEDQARLRLICIDNP